MDDLVSEYCSEFCFTVQGYKQSTIDCYFSTGKCPGVRSRVVQDDELIRQFSVTYGSQTISDLLDISGQFSIDLVQAALGLLCRQVLFSADGNLALSADQR